jgi:hypothetical protein
LAALAAIVGFAALPGVSGHASAAPLPSTAGSGTAGTSTGASAPSGLKIFAFTFPAPQSVMDAAFANPNIDGVSWMFTWQQLEPTPGKFNWQPITNAINLDRAHQKATILRVNAGRFSPAWVYTAGATPIKFTSADIVRQGATRNSLEMPVPWDPTFLSEWTNFIQGYGKQFNGNTNIYNVEMSGWGYIGEMVLPQATTSVRQQIYRDVPSGSTFDQSYVAAVERIIHAYRTAFPGTSTGIDIGEPLGTGSTTCTTTTPACRSNVLPTLMQDLVTTFPRVHVQQNGLCGTPSPYLTLMRSFVRAASATTRVGYQMVRGHNTPSEVAASIAIAQADHASFLELYSNDALNPLMQAQLHQLTH